MKEHVTDLLSEFVDGRLAEADRRMIEAHVEKCEPCARELKDLRSLTQVLASAPRRPLPTGFIQRLERRREHEKAAEADAPSVWLPMPAKLAASVAMAAVVCFVGYDALRGPGRVEDRVRELAPMSQLGPGEKFVDHRARLAERSLGAFGVSGAAGGGAGGGADGVLQGVARDAEDARQAKKGVHAPGAPIGVPEAAAPAQIDVPAATRLRAGSGRSAMTNEELVSHLEKERRKMGIAEIVPPGSISARGADADAPPMSREEAREYMKAMAEGLQRQRMGMENYHEPIALGGAAKPKLLKPQAPATEGAPLAEDKLAAAAPEERPGAKAGSLMAAAGIAQAPVAVIPYSSSSSADEALAEDGKARQSRADAKSNKSAPARGGMGAHSLAGAPAKKDMASANAAPAPALKLAAPSEPTAFAARSDAELAELWKRLAVSGDRPAVDFGGEMVVAVTAPQAVEIVRVWASGRRLVVEYRLLPDGQGNSAYRVIAKSDFPPELQRVK